MSSTTKKKAPAKGNAQPKRSIRLMILIPVVILGMVSVFTSLLGVNNIRKVNKNAAVIADEYMTAIEELASLENQTQSIHTTALSHIIATDFNTMVGLVSTIKSSEAEIEQKIQACSAFISPEDENYVALQSNYEAFKASIKQLMAFSANQKTAEAYAIANGDVSTYAKAMEDNIEALSLEIQEQSAQARGSLASVYAASLMSSVVTIIISVVSMLTAVFIVMRFVVHPILRAEKEINNIIRDIDNGQGDLTKRITITSNDEIAALGKGINTFMEKLQHIFTMIVDNSGKMEQVVSEVLGSVRTSNESATDLSAVTEELSATMQEVSNSANAINENAASVNEEVSRIAESSNELNAYSKNMKQHADHMESAARSNMEETGAKVNEILAVLNQAIEDAKSVDQVNSLTNDILSISSQTNLLALNASIEAARAGEAGRGFAVVASEISQLADSSRDAANNIQQINQIVTSAVRNLSVQASGLVTFMQESILPEFEGFVKEGNQYKENATYIEQTMDEFSHKTDILKDAVSEIVASIDAITSAIADGVEGVSGAAESTQALVFDMDNISQRMDENQRIAGDLQQETAIFKNL
ncbi:MAG: methyl-accepting chemotaxis protein [Lachnospiraceae bacterium]|nr:methyl-accepting chemotaxis protein [Lachnospiraceae bacterium]